MSAPGRAERVEAAVSTAWVCLAASRQGPDQTVLVGLVKEKQLADPRGVRQPVSDVDAPHMQRERFQPIQQVMEVVPK